MPTKTQGGQGLELPPDLPATEKDIERFLEKVDFSGDCYEWMAAKDEDGYGRFWARGKTRRAHKWLYESVYGRLAYGMTVDHTCVNPSCVRLEHLEPVTGEENRKRRHERNNRNEVVSSRLESGLRSGLRAVGGGVLPSTTLSYLTDRPRAHHRLPKKPRLPSKKCCGSTDDWVYARELPDYTVSRRGSIKRIRRPNGTRCDKLVAPMVQRKRGNRWLVRLASGNGDIFWLPGRRPKNADVPWGKVVLFFHGTPPPDGNWATTQYRVYHTDTDPSHQCMKNLEWLTPSEIQRRIKKRRPRLRAMPRSKDQEGAPGRRVGWKRPDMAASLQRIDAVSDEE